MPGFASFLWDPLYSCKSKFRMHTIASGISMPAEFILRKKGGSVFQDVVQ
jgi:hypothetical protein